MATLEELAEVESIRLVITARPDTKLPGGASISSLPQAPEASVRHYLDQRGVPEARKETL
jgi:hypothetical protein